MKSLLLASTIAALAFGAASSARAITIVQDPMHGFCVNVACADINFMGGTVTGNIPTGFDANGFGFTISPGPQTGPFFLVVAEPNDQTAVSPTTTGTINGAAVAGAGTAQGSWTSGNLDNQPLIHALFPSASPTNPISNFLPFTQSVDAGATGYNLFDVSLGTQTVQKPSLAGPSAMDLAIAGLPKGSMIFSFFDSTKSGWVATASSGTLFVNTGGGGGGGGSVPEPMTLSLLGVGLVGLGAAKRWWL